MQRFFKIYEEPQLGGLAFGSCQLTPPKPAGARPRTPWTDSTRLKFVVRFPTAGGRVIRRELQAANPRTYFSVTYNDLTNFLAANSQEAISGSYAVNQPICFDSVFSHSHLSIVTLHFSFLIFDVNWKSRQITASSFYSQLVPKTDCTYHVHGYQSNWN